jgi:predicted TIM-barrel fold metal-dependent hydrolase
MLIDCHVHTCATTSGRGQVSERVFNSFYFRFIRRRLGIIAPAGADFDAQVEAKLLQTLDEAKLLDKAVILAFDAVYDIEGGLDGGRTHLYVSNDYVAQLAGRHPKILFGCSIHPYRKDAVAELERCLARGAVLLKWLPLVQDFNPANERCFPLYEALAHYRLPLLSHTGGENSLPYLNPATADPMLLVPALKRGVTVIAAHCGTHSRPFERDYLPAFVRLAHDFEKLYGDTAALDLPTRSYAYKTILNDDVVRQKLVHGSDWPILPIPPGRVGWFAASRLLWKENNWLQRDILAKRALGFDEAYWQRAAKILRLEN